MNQNSELRSHLIDLLKGGQAYEPMDTILKSFAKEDRGKVPKGAEHSAWQILDHMVRALDDIVEFADNDDNRYREKSWPEEYWADEKLGDWDKSVRAYRKARKQMESLVLDPKRNLYKKLPFGSGQTLLRQALLAADHQSYHLGELVELRRWIK